MERIEHSSDKNNKLQWPYLRSVQTLVCALLMNGCGDTQKETQQKPSVKIYVIELGDSLSVIAQKHGISLHELVKSNKALDKKIYIFRNIFMRSFTASHFLFL